jgi:hypothetical protein
MYAWHNSFVAFVLPFLTASKIVTDISDAPLRIACIMQDWQPAPQTQNMTEISLTFLEL